MTLQTLAWACGGAAALALFRRQSADGCDRFLLGLCLAGLFAHVGWALLHAPRLAAWSGWWREPGAVSVLFVPLGVLCVAPWRESLAALPLALALARLGCLPYACCYPSPGAALPELSLLAGLHVAVRRRPALAPLIVLAGLGAVRLASLPLRVGPPRASGVEPAWIACVWMLAGACLQGRLGSAEGARAWLPARAGPSLRALASMLGVWLLFALGERLAGASAAALLATSLAGLALVAWPWHERMRGSPTKSLVVAVLASALLVALAGAGELDPLRALALVAVAPALEEILYRERLLAGLRHLAGTPLALLGSSALFALAHPEPGALPYAFVGGLLCGLLRLHGGGLALPIALHAGWNLLALLAGSGRA